MGMGSPLGNLRRVVTTLEKTWQAWFEERDPKKRKKLEANFEYLLCEVEIFFGYVSEEWRGAFKKPKKVPKYDHDFQSRFVDKFVPSWEKKKKAVR